jgi:hypothetical protein
VTSLRAGLRAAAVMSVVQSAKLNGPIIVASHNGWHVKPQRRFEGDLIQENPARLPTASQPLGAGTDDITMREVLGSADPILVIAGSENGTFDIEWISLRAALGAEDASRLLSLGLDGRIRLS